MPNDTAVVLEEECRRATGGRSVVWMDVNEAGPEVIMQSDNDPALGSSDLVLTRVVMHGHC